MFIDLGSARRILFLCRSNSNLVELCRVCRRKIGWGWGESCVDQAKSTPFFKGPFWEMGEGFPVGCKLPYRHEREVIFISADHNGAGPVICNRWEDVHLAKIIIGPQIQKVSKPCQRTTLGVLTNLF